LEQIGFIRKFRPKRFRRIDPQQIGKSSSEENDDDGMRMSANMMHDMSESTEFGLEFIAIITPHSQKSRK
jgi:hypothetical protein